MNKTKDLMLFFVGEVIGRTVRPADYRSRHMKAAKILLKDYDFDDICGALVSLRDRECGHFGYDSDRNLPNKLQGMEVLWAWGEPPLIERWLTPPERPPIYSHDFDKWVRRWGARAIERGDWDGIYIRQDPLAIESWLGDILGHFAFEESVKRWQALQEISQQNAPSLNTSPMTPPS